MSDYMAQKADQQIEAGLCERDRLLSELDTLTAKVKRYEDYINRCHDIVDHDFITTETKDGEKEAWVNLKTLQDLCDEALNNGEM